MTREEFIGRAADAILAQRMGRLLVPQASDDARYEAAQWATAALEAVGAWDLLESARMVSSYAVSWEPLTPGDIADLNRAIAKAEGR